MKLKIFTSWYLRNERLISSISLLGGFAFDIFALERIDLFWENLWVGVHLSIAAFGIILINLYENRKSRLSERAQGIIHFWLIMLIQFAFGALLSTFLVFYFRSGTLASSWPFLLMLSAVFVSNELLKFHYSRLILQTSVFFISIYSFAIFIVPVIVHRMDSWVFLLSGLVSLVVLALFILCLRYISRERFKESKKILIIAVTGITLFINLLYFTNLIPPIPLSLKDAGVYHSITRDFERNYIVTEESRSFWDFFRIYEPFRQVSGQPIFVFSSIFSPTNLNTHVIHEWQYYDDAKGEWVTKSQVKLLILGGRGDGFRTYSIRKVTDLGFWRVNVKTLQGQLIGRIKFKVKGIDILPKLITSVI